MNGIGVILLIASIAGMVILHKDKKKGIERAKWLSTKNCIIALVASIVIIGLSNQTSASTTTSADATTALAAANSQISLGLKGTALINSVMTAGVTKAEAVTAISKVETQQKGATVKAAADAKAQAIAQKKSDAIIAALAVKNVIPNTEAGIGTILGVKTDKKTDNSGSTKVALINKEYVINYNYSPLGGADKLNTELGTVLSEKIHSIYTKFPNVDKLKFVVIVPLQDKYGNVTWTPYLSFEFSRTINNKINWTSGVFDENTLLTIADNLQSLK